MTNAVAGSHTWSDSQWSSGSVAMIGSVLILGFGSCIVAGLSPPSAMGSDFMFLHGGDGWLGAGFCEVTMGVPGSG